MLTTAVFEFVQQFWSCDREW